MEKYVICIKKRKREEKDDKEKAIDDVVKPSPLPPPSAFLDITVREIRFKSNKTNGYAFLSNFWPFVDDAAYTACSGDLREICGRGHFQLKILEREYQSVEKFYQVCKFLAIDSYYASQTLVHLTDAREIKQKTSQKHWLQERGRFRSPSMNAAKVQYQIALHRFQLYSNQVMLLALYEKFLQNPSCGQALVKTDNAKLSEQGRFKKDYWCHTGQDRLGQLIMQVRASLVSGSAKDNLANLYTSLGDRIRL